MEELRLTKELRELTIDPEFRDLIPPLSEAEFSLLEESIVTNGCESALIVWNDTIVDGHNRYDICQKHSIPFAVVKKEFADRDAALMWMIQTQLGRRNLTTYQKGELALRFEPLLKAQAKERQATSTGGNAPQLVQNSSQAGCGEKTREKIADIAGVSHDTIKKVKKLVTSADDETKQHLRRGDVSINRAYSALMQKEHAGEVKTCERCKQEKPMSEFDIPSHNKGFTSICKSCEARSEQAAKDARAVSRTTTEPVVTLPVSEIDSETDAKPHGNFSTLGELRDTPEHFPKVIEIFRRTLDCCVNGIDYDQRQYKPSMVSAEHTAQLRGMIDEAYAETRAIFDRFIADTYGDRADA